MLKQTAVIASPWAESWLDLDGDFAVSQLVGCVQGSLNWVHLATGFPVWVRIQAPEEQFRLDESGVVVMCLDSSARRQ